MSDGKRQDAKMKEQQVVQHAAQAHVAAVMMGRGQWVSRGVRLKDATFEELPAKVQKEWKERHEANVGMPIRSNRCYCPVCGPKREEVAARTAKTRAAKKALDPAYGRKRGL